MGHEVDSFVVRPLRIPNTYLAYGLGILLSPFTFRKRKPDLVLADTLESGIAAAMISTIFKIPFVFDFIDDYSLIASYERRRLRYRFLEFLERVIPKRADGVIAETPTIEKFCLDLGIPEQKLCVIPNGADTGEFRPGITEYMLRKEFNLEDSKAVLFAGKINKYYNLDIILKAVPNVLKDFPHTKFLFVGAGDHLHSLRQLSLDLKVEDAVIFTGFLPVEDMPKMMNLSNVCVFPLPDDGALAIFEYMACAKPVVLPRGGTKKMGISREIIPDDCVLTVDATPEGFARGIRAFLNDEKGGREMGGRAREWVVGSHDWDRLAVIYEKALKKARLEF